MTGWLVVSSYSQTLIVSPHTILVIFLLFLELRALYVSMNCLMGMELSKLMRLECTIVTKVSLKLENFGGVSPLFIKFKTLFRAPFDYL